MNNIRTTILSALATLTLAACSTHEVERFDPSFEALNIGFTSASNLTQETTFNYSETAGERAVRFYARVTGMPVDYDRTFTLTAVDGNLDETQGSYRFETYVIAAGEVSGEYNIYFDPTLLPDPSSFVSDDGELVLKVAPNEYFASGALNQNELRFTLKNSLAKPEDWDAASGLFRPLSRYFGVYSTEKFQFMIENGCPIKFRVSYSQAVPTTLDGETTIMSENYALYLQQSFQLALEEYNDTHDTPLCDRLGNPITF